MRLPVLASLVFAASAGTAMAEQSTFAPITDAVQTASDAESVKRDKARALKAFGDVDLKHATITDVDANGDGHISFEELQNFDLKSF